MQQQDTIIEVRGVTKVFRTGRGEVQALAGVDLDVREGEYISIMGPSGSGKSTLLQIIGTLDRPTAGKVLLDGQDLAALDEAHIAAVRNRQMGFIFQSHFLLPQCTVWENVLVPTLANPKSEVRSLKSEVKPEPAESRAGRLLKRVGLNERMNHRPGQLSGGERQRVAVVRALINQPQLLLADEPTGALDHASATALGQLLVELNREEGVTLIVVTHALDLAKRMDRVLRLADGKLVEEGR